MLALVGAAAGVASNRAEGLSDLWRPLGYAIIGLCVTDKLLRDSQSVYGGLGLWRNWFYPQNVDDVSRFRRTKRRLLVLGILRRCLTTFGKQLVLGILWHCAVKCSDLVESWFYFRIWFIWLPKAFYFSERKEIVYLNLKCFLQVENQYKAR